MGAKSEKNWAGGGARRACGACGERWAAADGLCRRCWQRARRFRLRAERGALRADLPAEQIYGRIARPGWHRAVVGLPPRVWRTIGAQHGSRDPDAPPRSLADRVGDILLEWAEAKEASARAGTLEWGPALLAALAQPEPVGTPQERAAERLCDALRELVPQPQLQPGAARDGPPCPWGAAGWPDKAELPPGWDAAVYGRRQAWWLARPYERWSVGTWMAAHGWSIWELRQAAVALGRRAELETAEALRLRARAGYRARSG